MEWPNGKTFKIPFKMLNFTRDVFDSWLNDVAIEAGATFRDGTRCTNFEQISDGFEVSLHPKHGTIEKVRTKYLIGADGLSSTIRKIIRPQDFYGKGKRTSGITLNYYIEADREGSLDANTLYQFWNLDFNNLMFAWTYKKNDLWVVGTGYSEDIVKHTNQTANHLSYYSKYSADKKIF